MSEQEQEVEEQEQDLEKLGAEALGESMEALEESSGIADVEVGTEEVSSEEDEDLEPTDAPDPGGEYEFELSPGEKEKESEGIDPELFSKAVEMLERAGLMVVDPSKITREDKTQEEAELSARDKKKAQIAQILRRGRVNTKMANILDKHVPEGRAGKFVRNTPDDIAAHQSLGFELVHTSDPDGMHGAADNTIRVGDVVLMSISREDQDIMRELRAERVKANTGGRAQNEFLSKSEQAFDESETRIGGRS